MLPIRDDLIDGRRSNCRRQPTGRLAGSVYRRASDTCEMPRPVDNGVPG